MSDYRPRQNAKLTDADKARITAKVKKQSDKEKALKEKQAGKDKLLAEQKEQDALQVSLFDL